jgi:Calcineurin-like phosphoesterase
MSLSRRGFLVGAGATATATMLSQLNSRAAAAEAPLATFVSMPDFLNADVADVRDRPAWRPGMPNSINNSYRRAIDVVLDEVESENPDAVFIAGDLVQGHWGSDVDATGIFGPVDTFAQQLRAVTHAGRCYYGQWAERFSQRGLTVYPAIGDHEIGDNPWPVGEFKYRAFSTFKAVWAEHFTLDANGKNIYPIRPEGTPFEDTAYAVRLTPTVALITVDVFSKWSNGVHNTVSEGQIAWAEQTILDLRADGVQHIWFQGHVPCYVPVRTFASSNLQMEDHQHSSFWRLLRRHEDVVDFYLNGEVHDMTCYTDGRLAQISHGSLVAHGHENYLLIQVYADRIELTLKQFTGRILDNKDRLWGITNKRGPLKVEFDRGTRVVGTMTVANTGTRFTNRTGYLTEGTGYQPPEGSPIAPPGWVD